MRNPSFLQASAILATLLARYAEALLNITDTLSSYTDSECSSLLTSANATGTFTFSAGAASDFSSYQSLRGVAAPQTFQNLSLTVTVNSPVSEGATTASNTNLTNIWLGTPSYANLSSDTIPFSGCAILVPATDINAIERGQKDDGSCYQTFSKPCVDALTAQAVEIATGLTDTFTPGPNSNLTPSALPGICEQIANDLFKGGAPLPNDCMKFATQGLVWGESLSVARKSLSRPYP